MNEETAYIIIKNTTDINSFTIDDLITRKVSEDEWSFIVWRDINDAQNFLVNVARADAYYNIIKIDKNEYDEFISRSNLDQNKYKIEIK